MTFDEISYKFKLHHVYRHPSYKDDKSFSYGKFKIISGVCKPYPISTGYTDNVIFAESLIDGSTFFFHTNSVLFREAIKDIEYAKIIEFNSDLKSIINEEK